jgi:hypothetical protein
MRLNFLLHLICLLASLLLVCQNSWSQVDSKEENIPEVLLQTITINDSGKFGSILDSISSRGNIELNYNLNRIPIDQVVNVNMNNSRIIDILDYITEVTNTELKILGTNQILIVPFERVDRYGDLLGKVIEYKSNRPLIGANVFIEGYRIGDATDTDGIFKIENVPVGSYTIRFSYIGYEPVSIPDIIIKSDRITFQDAELRESAVLSDQVIVEGDFFSYLDVQPLSATNFSSEEIRRAATIGGDLSRVINGLPGFSNENEGNHIIARGGSSIENSFYLDNIRIPNINHFQLPGTTGGFFSLLNIDYVKNINVLTGGFSSRYGDILSSVIDIKYREGNREEFNSQFDLNFGGLTGQAEGPLSDGRGSWMLSARYGGTQFILKLLDEEEQPSSFIDIHSKVVYDINDNHQISFIDIYANDKWETPEQYSIINYLNWYGTFDIDQNIAGISWKYLWSEKGFSNTTISHIFNNYNLNFFSTATNEERLKYVNSEYIIQLRNSNFYKLSQNHKIEFGVEASHSKSTHHDWISGGFDLYGNYKSELIINAELEGTKLAGYFNYEWTPFSALKINPGLRVDYFDYNNKLNISPRFTSTLKLSEKLSLSGSVGIYNQNIPAFILAQNENFKNLKMPSAHHYVLGLNYLFAKDLKLSIEYYYKEYRELLFDVNLPGLYLLDEPINNLYMGDHINLVNGSRAINHGLEILLQKKFLNNFYGLASLTLSSSKYKDLDGIWRSRITDNRVLAAIEAGYKLNEEWEFNVRWAYAGGMPYTPFDLERSASLGNAVIDIDNINTRRLPYYSNLSIRVDKRFHFIHSNLIVYLSIWNLFNRENSSWYGWSEQYKTSLDYELISIVPVFGIEFEF